MLIADKLQLQAGANTTRGVFFATREQVPCVKLLIKHLVDYLRGSFLIDYMAVGHSPLYYELLIVCNNYMYIYATQCICVCTY